MLPSVADDNDLVFIMKSYFLDVAWVGDLVAELKVFTGQSLSIEAKQMDEVLAPSHHDNGLFWFEVQRRAL